MAGTQDLAIGTVLGSLGLDNTSERYPPRRVEERPPTVMINALLLENATSLPGNLSNMKGAFQMPMLKPAQNLNVAALKSNLA
mmetsp:Transcript_15661/g.21491  ORF Transcript_15661/g.21491 Transcript_15661/m.21491 type:complete len:83 (-) Transcript_15661:1015-1263(-)